MKRPSRRAAVAVGALALLGVAPLTAGLQASATPIVAAAAAAAAKTTLGSVNASATATGIRSPLYSHSGEDVEAEVPYSVAQLGGGGVAHAVTSVFWPGATGAHGGSTIGVLGIKGVPPSLDNDLNDPYVAEAPTVSGQNTVDKSNQGVTMKAVAKPNNVLATSGFGPGSGPGTAVGTISTTTHIVQTSTQAVIDARSQVSNVTVGGVLTIGSVITTAHAVTNGKTSTGTTTTQISGVKVAGLKATIDQKGLHVSGKSILPGSILNPVSQTVNTALKSIGLKVLLAPATKSIHGSTINLDSGNLLIELNNGQYKSQDNDTGRLLQFGGASISAVASPGYVPPKTPTQTSPTPTPTQATTAANSNPIPPAPSVGSNIPPPSGPSVASSAPPAVAPQLAANPLALPNGLGAGWVVLALALAGLVAFGMKRLPDEVLKPGGSACNLEEGT